MPYYFGLKAEAFYFADQPFEAFKAVCEAQAMIERCEDRWWVAEIHRLRGVFLTAIDADENQIEASFRAAVNMAREQKSISLAKRAEATYTEYRRRRDGEHGFRLPLCSSPEE